MLDSDTAAAIARSYMVAAFYSCKETEHVRGDCNRWQLSASEAVTDYYDNSSDNNEWTTANSTLTGVLPLMPVSHTYGSSMH